MQKGCQCVRVEYEQDEEQEQTIYNLRRLAVGVIDLEPTLVHLCTTTKNVPDHKHSYCGRASCLQIQ